MLQIPSLAFAASVTCPHPLALHRNQRQHPIPRLSSMSRLLLHVARVRKCCYPEIRPVRKSRPHTQPRSAQRAHQGGFRVYTLIGLQNSILISPPTSRTHAHTLTQTPLQKHHDNQNTHLRGGFITTALSELDKESQGEGKEQCYHMRTRMPQQQQQQQPRPLPSAVVAEAGLRARRRPSSLAVRTASRAMAAPSASAGTSAATRAARPARTALSPSASAPTLRPRPCHRRQQGPPPQPRGARSRAPTAVKPPPLLALL